MQSLMTAEELLVSADGHHPELVRGVLQVHKPPGKPLGWLAWRIVRRLDPYVEQHRLGSILIKSGYILQRGPDTVRGPDISFIRETPVPLDRIPKGYVEGPPDLAIEILSPDHRPAELSERLADYFAGGTRLVWVVDMARRRIVVHRPDGPPTTLQMSDTLDGEDVLPGFRCPAIFEL
jgi:Uma2 family endonuclease